MRWCLAACAAGVLGFGQNAPFGILRGDLVNWTGSPASGHILLTTSTGQHRCAFDARTYMERDGQRVAVGVFSPGDRLELVADRRPGSEHCYVRTVHAVDRVTAQPLPGRRPPLVRGSSPTEAWAPRGNMTFAGLVVRVSPDLMVLRTRDDPSKTVLLRSDTRYMTEGVRVDAAALKVNTRVFVRGGRNIDNEIEAYQVVWGDILRP